MWIYRRIIKIPWTVKLTNMKVLRRINWLELRKTVKFRELPYFAHMRNKLNSGSYSREKLKPRGVKEEEGFPAVTTSASDSKQHQPNYTTAQRIKLALLWWCPMSSTLRRRSRCYSSNQMLLSSKIISSIQKFFFQHNIQFHICFSSSQNRRLKMHKLAIITS